MKPDGVATAPSEPMEAEGTEPVAETTSNEDASQKRSTPSLPQPDEPLNEQEAPPAVNEAPGKAVDPKSKSKGPVKGKTTTTGPATIGPGTRPKATQSRVANGLPKTAASTITKKNFSATSVAAEKRKPTGAAAPSKKPIAPSATVTTSRTQPRVKAVGISRSTTATSSTKTGTTAGTATTLNKRLTTAASSVAKKPQTTAPVPRPATAPAAKPSTSSTAKATSAPKTNRTTGSSAPRPAATSSAGRTAIRTTSSTVANTSHTVTQLPFKPSVTASAVRKDVSKSGTTALAKKPAASTMSHLAVSKPLNSPTSIKASQPKLDDKKSVPTRKVHPSPQNTSSRPTSVKTTAASPSHRRAGSSTTAKPPKPTQSVLPLVVKGKFDAKEPTTGSVQISAAAVATVAVATAAAIVTEESVSVHEATTGVESSLDAPASDSLDVQENVNVQVLNANSQIVLDIPNTEPVAQEALIEAGPVEKTSQISSPINLESEELCSEKVDENIIAVVAPVAQEVVQQETITASFDNPAAAIVSSVGIEVAEKAELINNDCYEYVDEEEREGSQQVSVSEMSGTQPTEESRPGSAGLAGSLWRAGALLSELDSEDVSCSQQGASELSAPGVLEGTESMDDLGDASLKGADGEGASVGSPDFEKVPDILPNEDDDDDDDDDRVYDMEVGSERAEDLHRQHHDNEDDEEDEDVEMASEGITESGLESYGNADEDDLTEDYRLDNLNRIQPSPMVVTAPLAAPWNKSSCFADPWAQPPQPASTLLFSPSSEPLAADPETLTQAPAQARLDVRNPEKGPSSPHSPNLLESSLCSPQQSLLTAAKGDVSPKLGMSPPHASKSQCGTLSGPDLASDSNRDTIMQDEVKEYNNSSGIEIQSKELLPEPLNPAPTVMPDIMQDLGIHLECGDEEEELETLPADDVLGGPATAPESAPSSPSSATEDEATDTEGEMQISDPQPELLATGSTNGTTAVAHSLSTLEEREEMGGETEGGGGSDTPQSATSAASYGFDYMTSNSNAQSSAESCSKSPGIFSLENEEQLTDEAKDPSLLKELTLIPTTASGEKIDPLKSQHVEFQPHPEQQYMLCGESSELPESNSLPGAIPLESGLIDTLSPQHLEEEQDADTRHPYYSTVSENTDSPLKGKV
ncbi:serine/threonine-protein kinase WNK1-like [Xyrauchen texanus]|uniref:serine/threonine-protein kinase WNK1-like n=1 Tax=Xyrauchen texanus TaxID=154827 RepID=UPI0022421695|nr:serine/threonine-protein kinase WNK1-like [Xyrauchen texanus]